jgi:transcriptional regulator with XRE-family HTH domain
MSTVAIKTNLQAEFCRAVRLRREALGMNQGELAALAETTQSFISDIERGRRGPSLETVQKICKALKLRVKLSFRADVAHA